MTKDQNQNLQWVLDAKLPVLYNCETGVKIPFTIDIVSDSKYSKAKPDQDGRLFIVFTKNMKSKNSNLIQIVQWRSYITVNLH